METEETTSTEAIREESVDFGVRGMTCAACVRRVEQALNRLEGVSAASVNLASERAHVEVTPGRARPEDLYAAVRDAGYEVIEPASTNEGTADAERQAREDERLALRRRLFAAAAVTLPILVIQMLPMTWHGFGTWMHQIVGEQALYLILFVFGSIVQFGPGRRFYIQGWAAVRHGSPDMNTLVMLGTSAAYGYSVAVTFAPGIFPPGTAHV
ncbi:MAG: cation transporter, partial [Rhodothermales bacterium]